MYRTLLCQISLLAILSLNAQSLTLDQSFGTDGTIYQAEPAWAMSARPIELITLPSGKLLALLIADQSEVVVERFLSNGEPDTSFAVQGAFTSQTGTNNAIPVAMMVRPNGRIVVVMQISTPLVLRDLVLIQLLENGTLDTLFGNDGMIQHALTTNYRLNDAKLQQDGKLIVVGGSGSMLAMRFTLSGEVDSSFANNGIGLFSNGGFCRATAIDIADDGAIFLGGHKLNGEDALAWKLMKLTPNGQLDASFGVNGWWTLDLIPDPNYLTYRMESVSDIHIEPDGSIIVAGGLAFIPSREQFAVRRISATGSIISTFGDNGLLLVGAPEQRSVSKRLKFDPTGQYILCGVDFENNFGYELLILRFDMNGTVIDPLPNNSVFSQHMPVAPSPYCIGTLDHEGRMIVMTGYASKPIGKSSLTAFRMNITTSAMVGTDPMVSDLNFWPNPTAGHITFEVKNASTTFNSIELVDATGRMVLSSTYSTSISATVRNGNLELPAELKSGNYFLRYTSSDRVITKPLILTR